MAKKVALIHPQTGLMKKGYVFNDTEQVNDEARRKIGVAKL